MISSRRPRRKPARELRLDGLPAHGALPPMAKAAYVTGGTVYAEVGARQYPSTVEILYGGRVLCMMPRLADLQVLSVPVRDRLPPRRWRV